MKGAGALCPVVREIRCPLSALRTLRGVAVRPSDNRLDKPDGTSRIMGAIAAGRHACTLKD
ncbi:hypothetical protein GCM10010329_38570 [Streptomyces spiroverticillatus]|nr:hypothetical protein GCM10010329_38570 [Streptomyces spiroverticillatus]